MQKIMLIIMVWKSQFWYYRSTYTIIGCGSSFVVSTGFSLNEYRGTTINDITKKELNVNFREEKPSKFYTVFSPITQVT